MLLIIPSLSLHKGKCLFQIAGEKGTEGFYDKLSENPIELCKLWRKENAKTLHITDFDSFFEGGHEDNLNTILNLTQTVDIPITVLSDFKNVDECDNLIEKGVYRIAIFELALKDPEGVKALIEKYTTSRIVFFANVNDHKINFWHYGEELTEDKYISHLQALGANRLIYRDDKRFDSDLGPDYETLLNAATKSKMRITVFRSVTKPEHLWELQTYTHFGIDSVILGSPLYSNNFPCQKIWRLAEADLPLESKQ
ncbi:MAG: HisA/HisF-related TIM barrel protein [FCB group bacterium]|jgi:phosphoribosylformimino-5-aminoimidazole carboxamide ribotide isomerase